MSLVLCTSFLFPGDASFENDEPTLLQRANDADHTPCEVLGVSLSFTPVRVGLTGTRGVSYGPLPIWFYQLILGVTHDPIMMVRIHALLFSGVTAIALFRLARTMRLSPWFAALSMFSPWLWQFNRMLWDNTFCIPLAAIAVAGYADFLATRRRWGVILAATSIASMTLVHLMSLALVGGMIFHFAVFDRRSLVRFRWQLTVIGILWACVFIPYLKAMSEVHQPLNYPVIESTSVGWWHPLVGGQHLTAFGWLAESLSHLPAIVRICESLSLMANLAVWVGMALVLYRVCRRVRRRNFTPLDHMAVMCVFVAVCQGVLDGFERIDLMAHYFNATWIAYVLLAWYGVDGVRRRSRKWAMGVYVFAACYLAPVLFVLITGVYFIHVNGGTRAVDYGTVLREQMQAAQRISEFSPDCPVDMTYPQWSLFPWALRDLIDLLPPKTGPRPLRRVSVRYRNASLDDARIAIDDFPR
jgi:Dolichyl-phosphate-mannose-protein mannosyltransferase